MKEREREEKRKRKKRKREKEKKRKKKKEKKRKKREREGRGDLPSTNTSSESCSFNSSVEAKMRTFFLFLFLIFIDFFLECIIHPIANVSHLNLISNSFQIHFFFFSYSKSFRIIKKKMKDEFSILSKSVCVTIRGGRRIFSYPLSAGLVNDPV